MIHLTASDVPKILWNFWQFTARVTGDKKFAFEAAIRGGGWELDWFNAALVRAAKALRAAEMQQPRLEAVIQRLAPTEDPYAGMAQLLEGIASEEPAIPVLADYKEDFEGLAEIFSLLSRSVSATVFEKRQSIFATVDGRRINPFILVKGSEDLTYQRVESSAAMAALASRIGQHFLKSAWALLVPGLASHCVEAFNVPRDKVEKALSEYASSRGLI